MRNIPYERQAQLKVRYKDIIIGKFRADLLTSSAGCEGCWT